MNLTNFFSYSNGSNYHYAVTSTRTKVYATIYKNWGKKNESVMTKVVSLEDNKKIHDIFTVKL